MKKIFSLALFILTFISCQQNKKVINYLDFSKNNITEHQADIIFKTASLFPDKTQLSIAIIKNGNLDLIGTIRNNDTLSSIENSTKVFEIGSLSKLFTASILSSMVIEDQIQLHDNIDEYLPFPIKNDIKIKFKQLANHTSGMPKMPANINKGDGNNKFTNYNDAKIEEYLKDYLELISEPGKESHYSNIGVGVLAYTLGEIKDQEYDQLLFEYLIEPYNLSQTTDKYTDVKYDLVTGISRKGEETTNLELAAMTPAGGVLSNVNDLSKFVFAHFDSENKALELSRKETFKIDENTSQALGWRIEFINNRTYYCHNGKTRGYSSSIAMDVEKENAIIVLSNIETFRKPTISSIENLCLDLMKTLD